MYTVMCPMPHFNAFKAIIISTCAARLLHVEHGTPSKVSIFFFSWRKIALQYWLVSAYTNCIYTCALPLEPSFPSSHPTP